MIGVHKTFSLDCRLPVNSSRLECVHMDFLKNKGHHIDC